MQKVNSENTKTNVNTIPVITNIHCCCQDCFFHSVENICQSIDKAVAEKYHSCLCDTDIDNLVANSSKLKDFYLKRIKQLFCYLGIAYKLGWDNSTGIIRLDFRPSSQHKYEDKQPLPKETKALFLAITGFQQSIVLKAAKSYKLNGVSQENPVNIFSEQEISEILSAQVCQFIFAEGQTQNW